MEVAGSRNYKYPISKDGKFQKRIYLKKEFQHKYKAETGDIVSLDNEGTLCNQTEFVLSPHQEFIKNFIHPSTPYNGILLYHGMGSGKTCSAIGISEQFRRAHSHDKSFKKILIVASPNVQENFKLQLFDSNKLVKRNGVWTLEGCVGSSLLFELKDYDLQNMKKEDISNKITKMINKHYLFLGYEKLANIIHRIVTNISIDDESKRQKMIKDKLGKFFENSMIIIDEAHNIRLGGNDKDKKTAQMLDILTTHVKRNKIILLTGTPMYNDSKEIIFLLNLLRKNDGLGKISMREIFDKDGNILPEQGDGKVVGKQALINKANGYISYVRGENPFSFPFKIYPRDFNSDYSIGKFEYPTKQYNDIPIQKPLMFLDTYVNELGEQQTAGYQYFTSKIKNPDAELTQTSGYKEVQNSIFALNICYPDNSSPQGEAKFLTGKAGLASVVSRNDENKYEYIDQTNRVFSSENIGIYSSKIKAIIDMVERSEGIILIYSQYIDAGLVPIALALEELGMSRIQSDSNLFSTRRPNASRKSSRYSMITGNVRYSPNNNKELSVINGADNLNGEKCSVVLISQAGSEGIDFKNLRQVHILEPWYNLNRIEQIVGRAIRNCSHKLLPLEKRNSQIFLHTSYIDRETECVDLMLYRKCEEKAKRIGDVQKILKSISIDCLLNESQKQFSSLDQTITINLSTGVSIDYNIQDKPYSLVCDYQDTCDYKCHNIKEENDVINSSTFGYEHSINPQMVEKVKRLFLVRNVYKRKDLIELLKTNDENSLESIYGALTHLIENRQEYLIDKYGSKGNLINVKDLYLFQPVEFSSYTSLYDKTRGLKSKVKTLRVTSSAKIDHTKVKSARKGAVPQKQKVFKVLERLGKDYETGMAVIGTLKDKSLEYYPNYSLVVNKMNELSQTIQISDANKELFLIEKMIESIPYEDELLLVNYLFDDDSQLDKLQGKLKALYERHNVKESSIGKVLFLINIGDNVDSEEGITGLFNARLTPLIKVENGNGVQQFRPIKTSEVMQIQGELTSMLGLDKLTKLHKYIVFNGYNSKTDDYQPKFKNTEEFKKTKKNKGRFFINESPKNMIPVLNNLIGEDIIQPKIFTKEQLVIVLELVSKYQNQNKDEMFYLSKIQNTDTYLKQIK